MSTHLVFAWVSADLCGGGGVDGVATSAVSGFIIQSTSFVRSVIMSNRVPPR